MQTNITPTISAKSLFQAIVFFLLHVISSGALCQNDKDFMDGRETIYCTSCKATIADMPKEVLFGIQINNNGEVYFSMNNRVWFDKIFKNNSCGVAIDIISKEKYSCVKDLQEKTGIPRGTVLPGVYKPDLLKNATELVEGGIFTKVGNIPRSLIGKELEGNLAILNGPYVCYYTNFVDIDRSMWHLLPMGLFTDSIVNEYVDGSSIGKKDFFTYSRKIQLQIPFTKGSTLFDSNYLKSYYDSAKLFNARIKKIEIRAYSSVEGTEKSNKEIMAKRASNMLQALEKYQHPLKRAAIITAENWLDFFTDIKDTKFSGLANKSKLEIKQQLTNPKLAVEIEPLLSAHRKVIATLYLEEKSPFTADTDSSISNEFSAALISKNIAKAQAIQKEIADRIADNQLPLSFIDKIEIPKSKDYTPVLNDREVYRYLLKATDEYQAFENFLELKKIDPDNGRLNYNICALRFFIWQYGNDTLSKSVLLDEIETLSKQGIQTVLTKRMEINYYILKSEDQMKNFDYDGKDSSLNEIRNIYTKITASDEDIYSLAKYYSYYSHQEWGQEIIEPRIADVNVSEDLAFYYLNLLFFQPSMYDTEEFTNAALNAINLDRTRFCRLFSPNGNGGASMQLLDYEYIKSLYCAECK